MLDELILRLPEEISVSENIRLHYVDSRTPLERATALKADIPAYVASLYELTSDTETIDAIVNFFVIPKVLAQLDLQEKLAFIDLLIEPLINELPWINTTREQSATTDLTRPDVDEMIELYQQQVQSPLSELSEKKNFTNTILTLTIIKLISNQLKACQNYLNNGPQLIITNTH